MEGDENAMAVTRIFVGGLGESVGEGDLQKTFSSLGVIKNVEFVRSRGRSFAYLDFQPSSPASLSKLFSTYNGCIWKGGRLRLEKAKEHYLTRLKQEWAEDEMEERRTNDCIVNENTDDPEPSKVQDPKKMQIRLFFPKLRKVKALPYSGTGKHKYSFQRFELPSLPIYFCDCEEHSRASKSVVENQAVNLEDKSGSINEEERNMMSTVMNNIFERGLSLRNAHKKTKTNADMETNFPSHDDSSLEIRSDEETDSDNLVMNMVGSSGGKLGFPNKLNKDIIVKDQVPSSRKRRSLGDGLNKSKVKAHKGDDPSSSLNPFSKKPVPENSGNMEENVFTVPDGNGDLKPHPKQPNRVKRAKPTKQKASIHQSEGSSIRGKLSSRELVNEKENNSLNKSKILQSTPLKDLPKSNDTDNGCLIDGRNGNAVKLQANETIESIKAPSGTPKDSAGPKSSDFSEFKDHSKKKSEGQAWMQKSSWRELVGGMGGNSFSISNILPGIPNSPMSNSVNVASSMETKAKLFESEVSTGAVSNDARLSKNGNLHSKSNNSNDAPNMETSAVRRQIRPGVGDPQLHETTERNSQNEEVDNFSDGKPSKNESHKVSDRRVVAEPEIGASCTFMRSAASEKEWIKTRAALRGDLKKKSSDK